MNRMNSLQVKRAHLIAAVAIALLCVLGLSVTQAAPQAPAHPADAVQLVPTPITTPSMLDALQTTSNVTVGGNLNVTGVITGGVLQYPTPGLKQICGSSTITGTGALAHGLSTPSYVQVSLNTDANGDHVRVSSANASGTVTAKVWNSALTPVAAQTPVTVDWCVIGTP